MVDKISACTESRVYAGRYSAGSDTVWARRGDRLLNRDVTPADTAESHNVSYNVGKKRANQYVLKVINRV